MAAMQQKQRNQQKQQQRRLRRGALAAAAGLVGIRALAPSSLSSASAFAGVAPAPASVAQPSSSFGGFATTQGVATRGRVARKAAEVAAAADAAAAAAPLFGVFDIAKVASDPGTPGLLAQCAAASSLVLAGTYCVKKEEEHHEEQEKKKAAEKAAMEAKGIVLKEEAEEYDIWRESLLRYLGYSNELGEALRPVLPAAYLASYVAAFSYVFADSLDKAGRADKKAKKAAVRMAFVSFDKDGDGALSKDEVKGAFAELKVPFTDDKFDVVFGKMDTSKNSMIEIEEFMAAYDRADAEIIALIEAHAKENEKGSSNPLENPSLVAGADALIWQTIASVALPGFTINRFVTLTEMACEGQAAANPIAEYFPTVFGLAMIPVICKPLDVLADFGLDATLRPLLFAAIDADKSGTIEFNELKAKMEKMDGKFDEKYLRELFDDLDTNKDGCISIEEWRMGGYKKYKEAVGLQLA